PAMTQAFRQRPELVALNKGALSDPRVTIINADAAVWLQNSTQTFDLAIVDFPDPSSFALGKLFSVPFYGVLKKHIS
ncbi:polyamine aminopropyltransferase, partial [Acinetobacter baumannii]